MADSSIARLRHDLANPLAALLTETQLLLLNEASLEPDVVRALREIESLARVMRDMLAASRAADRPEEPT